MGFFDSCYIPVMCQLNFLVAQGLVQKSSLQCAFDLSESITKQKVHYHADEVLPISDFGRFYPAVMKEPSRYIHAQP